ncbi:MAG: hypothetical protein C0428_14345 [Polaromonas sp.]|nr:hypothetical protein [Polaromonas sp.]
MKLRRTTFSIDADLPPQKAASPHVPVAPHLWRRVTLLFICIAAGSAIGVGAQHLTGSSLWFLAIPAVVLFAWLFVADPTACLPPTDRSSRSGSASEQ